MTWHTMTKREWSTIQAELGRDLPSMRLAALIATKCNNRKDESRITIEVPDEGERILAAKLEDITAVNRIRFAGAKIDRCESCGIAIWWLIQESRVFPTPAPIEIAHAANANIIADPERGTYRIVAPGQGERLNHFARCPEQSSWRRLEGGGVLHINTRGSKRR
jgi:hypothetical protein